MTDFVQTPHPGSRLDAVAQAEAHASPVEEIRTISGEGIPVVTVAEILPSQGRGYCVLLGQANQVLRILPRDDNRRSAIILAIDNDVYISNSKDSAVLAAAQGASGTNAFYLPAGIAVPVANKGAWYAAVTTTATQSRVSVMTSLDGEP